MSERYPELKGNQGFRELRVQLEATERSRRPGLKNVPATTNLEVPLYRYVGRTNC